MNKEELNKEVQKYIIKEMKDNIVKMGYNKCFELFECLVPAKVRLRYRKFLKLAYDELKGEVNDK